MDDSAPDNPPDTHVRIDGLNFDNLTSVELTQLSDELDKKNEYIALENQLFELHLKRVTAHDSANASGSSRIVASATETSSDDKHHQDAAKRDVLADDAGALRRRKRGDKSKQVDMVTTLSSEQKTEIATRELEELRDEIEQEKSDWGKVIDNLKAEMEEIDIRLAEVKKDIYEFKRDIVQLALSERTGKVMAEKVLRYFEDRLRARDTTIEKIRLKNNTLKTHKNKLLLQLRQKEEMGEVLHAIDFDQLKIENHQYLAKIEERNTELLKLKMTSGNIAQTLNIFKKRLGVLTKESDNLNRETQQRCQLIIKLKAEGELVLRERVKAASLNKVLKSQYEQFSVPSVMEYVMIKARQEEYQKRVKSCRRKVEIAQLSLVRMQKMILTAQETPEPEALWPNARKQRPQFELDSRTSLSGTHSSTKPYSRPVPM